MAEKIILISAIILVILAGCSSSPVLNFSTGQCNSSIDPYSKPVEGILDKTWTNQNTMVVNGFVKTYCGGANISGDYSIEGSSLTLKYKIKTAEAVTSCICAHKLIYEISNLEKKDYSVSIVSG